MPGQAVTHMKADVAIIGGGVLGLWLANKLATGGFRVALIESRAKLAGGASTRNEGWLHAGTYHAAAILDNHRALQVTEQTQDGFRQILRFAPEALEDPATKSYVLLKKDETDRTLSMWRQANVTHIPIELNAFHRKEPRVQLDVVQSVFEVADHSINTRILYTKLMNSAIYFAATLLAETRIERFEGPEVHLNSSIGRVILQAHIFVHTASYGIKALFQQHFQHDVPLRFWKSHLLDMPRIGTNNVFYVAPARVA